MSKPQNIHGLILTIADFNPNNGLALNQGHTCTYIASLIRPCARIQMYIYMHTYIHTHDKYVQLQLQPLYKYNLCTEIKQEVKVTIPTNMLLYPLIVT